MKTTLFVPVRNEIIGLKAIMPKIDRKWVDEILVIDGDSTDGSRDVLKRIQEIDSRVRVINFRGNFGKSAALEAAFRRARGRFVATVEIVIPADNENVDFMDLWLTDIISLQVYEPMLSEVLRPEIWQ